MGIKMNKSNNTNLVLNRVYYTGDVNPEHGGLIYWLESNDSVYAYEIVEFSPISFSNMIVPITLNVLDNATHEQIHEAYYEGDYESDSYDGFYFMKAIDRDYTNASNLDIIDQFVRYDFNIWNLIKSQIGISKGRAIYTANGKK